MTTLVLLCLLLAGVASASVYRAEYAAAAPGDIESASGSLELVFDRDQPFYYKATLYDVSEITGIHLHLEGNSSDGLYGGPLIIALTNTTAANGQTPVSSTPNAPLIQEGVKTSADLQANSMTQQVQARIYALGLAGKPPSRPDELRQLLDINKVYTDVHSITRVSPEGVTRGRLARIDDTTPPQARTDYAQAIAKAAAQAQSGGASSASASAQASASTAGK